MDYLRLRIHESRHWSWYVHANQAYLGRMVLVLARPFLGSFAGCTKDEWLSLRQEIQMYENFISTLFSPDRFNYTQMGNEMPQMHVHAIPRYSTLRTWGGKDFSDVRWGQNPSPKPPSPLSESELYEFSKWLVDEFTRFGVAMQYSSKTAMVD